MSELKDFSDMVAQDLLPEDKHGSFIELVPILILIAKEVAPLIQDCLEDDTNNEEIGPSLQRMAAECRNNSFKSRLRKARLGLLIRRSTSRRERQLLGGTTKIADAYVQAASLCSPDTMNAVWNEVTQ